MSTIKLHIFYLLVVIGVFQQGCSTPQQHDFSEKNLRAKVCVDFSDPVLNSRKIFLFGSIDAQAAEETIQQLLYLDNLEEKPIDLFIQSPGGDMKGAFAIEQTIRLLQSPLNTYALSECNSGGAMLLAAGTGDRSAFDGAMIILHGLKIGGNPPEGVVEILQDSYTDFWHKKTKLPEAWLPLPFDSTRVLSAEQALEYGIVDQIIAR